MGKIIILIGAFSIIFNLGFSQDKYWVFFTDKNKVEFNPTEYFDQKAIKRRAKQNLPLYDYTDLPVNPDYFNTVSSNCDSIGTVTRWFNGVSCFLTEQQKEKLGLYPFVKSIELIESESSICERNQTLESEVGQEILAHAQLERMAGHVMRDSGYTGKGMRIAIIDAGFVGVNYLDAFEHIRDRNGIIGVYDFLKKKENSYAGHSHGTMVLSNIAGIVDDIPYGMATEAEFLLARTEKGFKESIKEEDLWLAAMEWADKNGADIINTSLGYTARRYFRKDMDGKHSRIAAAGNLAAKKGMLCVVSAGNSGDDAWRIIATPADADSVLTVGAINPWTNIHTSWSSVGPSADKRIKPNVSAYGHAMTSSKEGEKETEGTSFSSPLIAGFAACVWQLDSNLTAMELHKKIEESADLYPYYDYAHGYGVPQATYFLHNETKKVDTTFKLVVEMDDTTATGNINVVIKDEAFEKESMIVYNYFDPELTTAYEGEELLDKKKDQFHIPDSYFDVNSSHIKSNTSKYLYYAYENDEGYLSKYFVVGVDKKEVLTVNIKDLPDNIVKIKIYYKGFMDIIEIEK